MTTTTWLSETTASHHYADVNGLHLFYLTLGPTEAEGSDDRGAPTRHRPLVILHGGLASSESWGPVLPALARHRLVIAPDLQGHGRTADVDRPIRADLMADDIAALIAHLALGTVDVLGYSLGGGVALELATRHPELIGRLVLVSAWPNADDVYPEMRAQQGQLSGAAAEFMKDTPMYQLYQAVAPRPEDFPRLLDKMGENMAHGYDYREQVRSLRVPTLLVAGDSDMAPVRVFAQAFESLGGNQRDGGWMGEGRPEGGHALAVLPRTTHYTSFSSPLLAPVAEAFLDE
jgi:pimeloyl-ACP methyl ester carboxylesterase